MEHFKTLTKNQGGQTESFLLLFQIMLVLKEKPIDDS